MIVRMDADTVIAALGLEPHPEGGHYLETFRDDACSAIYFLLRRGEQSAPHRVRDRAEIWTYHAGAPLRLECRSDATAAPQVVDLGTDLGAGQRPQAVVLPSAWQQARSLGDWTLAGCIVAPPFTFEAFELEHTS